MGIRLVEPIFATALTFDTLPTPLFDFGRKSGDQIRNQRVDFERHKAERVNRLGMLPVWVLEGLFNFLPGFRAPIADERFRHSTGKALAPLGPGWRLSSMR